MGLVPMRGLITCAVGLYIATVGVPAHAQPAAANGSSRVFALAFLDYDRAPRMVSAASSFNEDTLREIALSGERAALVAAAAVEAARAAPRLRRAQPASLAVRDPIAAVIRWR